MSQEVLCFACTSRIRSRSPVSVAYSTSANLCSVIVYVGSRYHCNPDAVHFFFPPSSTLLGFTPPVCVASSHIFHHPSTHVMTHGRHTFPTLSRACLPSLLSSKHVDCTPLHHIATDPSISPPPRYVHSTPAVISFVIRALAGGGLHKSTLHL